MVELDFRYGLPFWQVTLIHKANSITLDNVLLDTGSGGTVFKMDRVDELGVTIEKDDAIETISGVGGVEFVYKKTIDGINLGGLEISDFTVEVGVMDLK